MSDLIFIGMTLLLLILTRGLIEVCTRLMEGKS